MSEVGWDSCVDVEFLFLEYVLATGEVSSLVPLRVAKHQRSGSEALVFAPGRDEVWLPSLAYVFMEHCRANWRAANGEVNDVTTAVEFPYVDVPEMDDLPLQLKKVAGWT